jgi:hypothetical protein
LRPVPTPVRTTLTCAVAALLALAPSACGGSDDDSSAEQPTAAPDAASFPSAGDKTLEDLTAELAPGDEVVVSPAGQVFTQGENRFGFGVFSLDGEQITDADVAIYVAPADGGPNAKALGPYPARVESLETEPAFTAETTASDPDSAKVVYVSEIELDRPGEWRAIAAVEHDGELVAVRMPSLVVQRGDPIPGAGDPAPRVHTPTAEQVANVQEIDTRIPPSSLHDVDLAEALGKKPVVLLFATPALCQSRVCGPVVDIAEQVKRDRPEDAAYIHMEIYEDNLANKGVREQVKAYNLPTEPWLFVIDCDGKVDSRVEGAFSVAELDAAVDRVANSC